MNGYKTVLVRILCMFLAVVVALSASCGQDASTDVDTSQSQDTTTVPVIEEIKPSFEKCDYEGENFHILAPDWGLYSDYFFADDQNGDIMNDAIYERTQLTEEYLNVDITYSCEGIIHEILDKVNNSVMSGDDVYQLVLTHCMSRVSQLLVNGLLYDWNDFEYCNLDNDYWSHNCNEMLSVNDHQYYAISDYMIPDPNCILFSKQMITDFKLNDPYQLVRSGNWTIDKFIEMSSDITSDLNGNNEFDIDDRYGLGTPNDWYWNSFYYSSDIYLVNKTSDGGFELSLNNERTVNLMEKLDSLLNKSENAFIYSHTAEKSEQLTIDSGRILFQIAAVHSLNTLRDSDIDFGILPYPKFSEDQDGYQTNDWSGLMCVPKNIKNSEMVGKTCELLAYFSDSTTLPAYFDVMLGEKLSRDQESKEMLDLIFDNIVFDPGMNYLAFNANMMSLFYAIPFMLIKEEENTFASWYATYEKGAVAEIEEFVKGVAELDE